MFVIRRKICALGQRSVACMPAFREWYVLQLFIDIKLTIYYSTFIAFIKSNTAQFLGWLNYTLHRNIV